jgi:hypothetical protein
VTPVKQQQQQQQQQQVHLGPPMPVSNTLLHS